MTTEALTHDPAGAWGRLRARRQAKRGGPRSTLWLVGLALLALALAALSLAEGVSATEVRVRGVFGAVLGYLGGQPFILLFLMVAAGYTLARLKIRGVGLGATGSTLVVALGTSVWAAARHDVHFELPTFASTIFFNLFMFAVGMKVGPQFLAGLRRDAAKFILLAFLVPIASVLLTIAFGALVDLPPGMLPGIFAGSNTATPALGSAQAAYASGAIALPEGTSVEQAIANLSAAFAFSYCLSMVLFIVALKVVPRLLGRDLAADAKSYEREVQAGEPLPGALGFGAVAGAATRAFRVENPELAGRTLAHLRVITPFLTIERVQRDGAILESSDALVLRVGDVVVLYGRIERVIAAAPRIGPERDAPELREGPVETVEVVIHSPEIEGRTLTELAAGGGHGFVLNGLFRGGESVPFGPTSEVRIGDVLRVTGNPKRIADLERRIGRVVRPSVSTDIVTLAVGLVLGALLGAITIPAGNVRLTLSSSVGLLLAGIVLSTLRTRNPALGGPFPEPARQLLEDLGLNVFVAVLGLNSGLGVLSAVRGGAVLPILGACLLIGFIPPFVAWVIGQYRMKMNSAILAGAVAGARCNSAGLRASQEAAQSNVPAISYPVAFAISNVLFTFMAYLMTFVR